MADAAIPVLVLEDKHDNPEHYEFIRGRWLKKESVGRREHSMLELAVLNLLIPMAQRLNCTVLHEWTIVNGEEKLIPDVTFSFPNAAERDGYLVAPAMLVVESRSKGQRLKSLFDKCRKDYHRVGTPYCWVLDGEEQAAYECHVEMNGMQRLVDRLTAGPDISIPVSALDWP